ncbi:MAG: DNA repair protein RecN [Deltaproteobacteria bacterium HGW-Deltaproteobacteria-4]|nr:MAG: DNA repair protein RecN [Deltaproteobacteria bacterium HGW-Deltaproteobacteria-4]
MLCELNIRNFVIIDRLSLTFAAGLNVLTGETGAGKSIIIDAIDLLLGGKARTDLIRTGEEEAVVEALFDLRAAANLRAALADAGFDNGDELLVRRVLSLSGKNRIYVNGTLATAAQLQTWLTQIVAIYGQHEQFTLARAETHGQLLDSYAGILIELSSYRRLFEQIRKLREELARFDRAEQERQQRLDLLDYQHKEIAAADLHPGEDVQLLAERTLQQHAEKLAGIAGGGYDDLYAKEGAICETLARLASQLGEGAAIDPYLAPLAEAVQSSYYALEDSATQLRAYAKKITFDAARMEEIEARLDLLHRLKRKYGNTIEAILDHFASVTREFADLSNLDATRGAWEKQLREDEVALQQLGASLTRARKAAAISLQQGVEGELRDLAMPKARFSVALTSLPAPGPLGCEKIEFLLQANPGEVARPLAKVASGGELSRLMLAIQRTAPAGEEVATLIFDEVDAGIGGAAATAVGEKLRAVATGRQVLCITHLPQVAAFAHHHFKVGKEETVDARTITTVRLLAAEEQVSEIARMLGGAKITASTTTHARELISHSVGPDYMEDHHDS